MALESLLNLLTVHHHAIFFTSYTLLISQETNNETQTKQNKPVKFFRVSCLALLYDMDEVVCEDERYALPLDAKLGLEVAQDVAEVYVKELERRERRSMIAMDPRKRIIGIKQRACPTCPVLRTMMLSLWRSPMPRT